MLSGKLDSITLDDVQRFAADIADFHAAGRHSHITGLVRSRPACRRL
jgi:hypothetical protein